MTLQNVFQLYENICGFKQCKALSRAIFDRELKGQFPNLIPFKKSTDCRTCKHFKEEKSRKVISEMQKGKIDEEESNHIANVKAIKSELMQSIDPMDESTEIFIFELQHPLEMPCVSIDESYDRKPVWFSNLCIYDEKRKQAYMYV